MDGTLFTRPNSGTPVDEYKLQNSSKQQIFKYELKRAYIIQERLLIIVYLLYLHCNPLQGNYRVELLHREIPVVITGNEFTEYNFLLGYISFPVLLTLKLLL